MNFLQVGLLGFYKIFSGTEILNTRWGRAVFEKSYWLYKRYCEAGSTELLHRWVEPTAVVIDVGANIGYFTLQFAAWLREGGKVLAVEPEPVNYRQLQRAVRRAGYASVVEAVQVAAADFSGEGMLEINPVHPGDHSLGTTGLPVAVTTLDSLVAARAWPAVSLIKIDVQGAEARVLAGARETITRFKPVLFIEIDPKKLQQHGTTDQALMASIAADGYGFHIIEGKKLSKRLTLSEVAALARARGYLDVLCCQ